MIKQHFERVLRDYTSEKSKLFKGNGLANSIRHEVVNDLQNVASLPETYSIHGSAGQGYWADIPWICIFDESITSTAQDGYYIVYLFDSQMNGLYLSLNQGWTQYYEKYGTKEGKEKIRSNAKLFQHLLRTTLNDFSFSPIDLHATNTLGRGYELGHICGSYYSRDTIPEDNVLINDLRNLISVYREIKGIVGADIFNLNLVYQPEENNDEDEPLPIELIDVNKIVGQSRSPEELDNILQKIEEKYKHAEPQIFRRIARAIARNPIIAKVVKEKANYTCGLCGSRGFEKKNGGNYIEVHHVKELSQSGQDIPSNLIAVCATCHRALHYGSAAAISQRKQMTSV